MDTESDILFDKSPFYVVADVPATTYPVFILEHLRINRQYNLLLLGQSGFTFFKYQTQQKEARYEVVQKRPVNFKKILTASFDFREESVGVIFEAEPTVVKIFVLNEAFLKSQAPSFHVNVPSFRSPWKGVYLFDQSTNCSSASIEVRKRMRAMNFENRMEVCTLYQSTHVVLLCEKQKKLFVVKVANNFANSYKLDSDCGLIRRSQPDLPRQLDSPPLQSKRKHCAC